MRHFTIGILAAVLLAPVFASALTNDDTLQQKIEALRAQIAQLQEQIQSIIAASGDMPSDDTPADNTATGSAGSPAGASQGTTACPIIYNSLYVGSRGSEVSSLQKFLAGRGLLTADLVTGYYGPLTESAVRNLQSQQGIVSSGTPDTTGWGVVGFRTRSAIADLCSGSERANNARPSTQTTPAISSGASSAPSACTEAPHPTRVCASPWIAVKNSGGCTTGWQCAVSSRVDASNKSPSINSINGPTSLAVGETGRWTVNASDPEGYPLAYSFSSGDTSAAIVRIGEIAQGFTDAQSFVHSYGTRGLYILTAEVQDSAGNTAQSSLRVSVGGGSSPSSGLSSGTAYTPNYDYGANVGLPGGSASVQTQSQSSTSDTRNTSSSGCTFDGNPVAEWAIVACSSSRGRELTLSHMACYQGKWISGEKDVRSLRYESIGGGVLDTVTCKLPSSN
ncbi:MAG: peptidoglycan-binding protein [Patescibacteria group bacterium]|nr:peptidoglycan-binding protein [Patescibacteria group bacterium]